MSRFHWKNMARRMGKVYPPIQWPAEFMERAKARPAKPLVYNIFPTLFGKANA